MSIEKILVCIVAALAQSIATTVIVNKQIGLSKNNRIKVFNIVMLVYFIFVFLYLPNQLRFLMFILVLSASIYLILKVKDKNVVLYSFNTTMVLSISEIVISLMLVITGIDSDKIVKIQLYNLLANVLISLFAIVLINIPLFKKLVNKEIKLFRQNKKLIRYFYAFIIILYLITLKNGFEFLLMSNYYVNILFIIGIVTILTTIIKNELKYNQLEEENKQMLNHVTKYEKIITEQGKANHEFKNQLMVIRGYAQMNSPKLIEYVDSLTQDANKTHSSFLISQLNKFPEGGIKGLLYYKLSVMDDNNIKYEITVQKGVKTSLNNLSTSFYKNITKILGVLLDNAIDASSKSKLRKIIIEVTRDKGFIVFNICNTYKGKIDITKIGTGFTTKGSGHGYGLKLAKDIINGNNSFALENSLDGDYYICRLKIKVMRKTNNK